jgi:hypothetical protein
METLEKPQLNGVSRVRVVKWHPDYHQDAEVNEAIKLGWQLILVQPGCEHPCFVLGWTGPETAPQTEWEKSCSRFADAVRLKYG